METHTKVMLKKGEIVNILSQIHLFPRSILYKKVIFGLMRLCIIMGV